MNTPTEKAYEIKVSGSRNFRIYVSEIEAFLQNYDDFLDKFNRESLKGYKWWWDLPVIEGIPILKRKFQREKSKFLSPKNFTFYTKERLLKKHRGRIIKNLDDSLESRIKEIQSEEYSYKMWRNILVYGVTFGCYVYTIITKSDRGLLNAALYTPALVGDAALAMSYPISALESIKETKSMVLETLKDSKKKFELYEVNNKVNKKC